jgi:cell division protein FtsL
MSKRIPKISPAANRTMAAPVRTAPPASKPPPGSSARKPKTKTAAPRAKFNAAAIKHSLIILFPFSVFLFFGLVLIWERVKVRELATAIAQLETQRNQLADQNVKFKNQVEQLSGYGRISRLATQRLGLVAVPQQTILVKDE